MRNSPSTTHSPDVDVERDDFGGLHRDVAALIERRDMLRLLGGFSIAGLLAACAPGTGGEGGGTATSSTAAPSVPSATPSTVSPTTTSAAAPTTTALASDLAAGAGVEIPDETAGPFPANGTNGPNVLDVDGVVRADLRPSFGASSGTAEGVAIAFDLLVVEADSGAAMSGAAVYLWHCTADGRYSIYEVTDQNYLRGVQVADEEGRLSFTSVFPGCYPGRWPHAHFEVYESLEAAAAGASTIKTSQLALPRADCETVYGDGRYGDSAGNLARLSLDSDGVFRDGWDDQLATMSGSIDAGYAASLLVRA